MDQRSRKFEDERITIEDSINPLIDGMNQTAFDLLMPFVFWDGKYVSSGKVAGRPAPSFLFFMSSLDNRKIRNGLGLHWR